MHPVLATLRGKPWSPLSLSLFLSVRLRLALLATARAMEHPTPQDPGGPSEARGLGPVPHSGQPEHVQDRLHDHGHGEERECAGRLGRENRGVVRSIVEIFPCSSVKTLVKSSVYTSKCWEVSTS